MLGPIVPERMGFVNLATDEGYKVQYQPVAFTESVSAEWRSVQLPGYSHEVLFYSHTTSHNTGFALKFLGIDDAEVEAINLLKRFLLSLVYPVEDGTSPPDVLVIWPNTLRMIGVIRKVDIANEAFRQDGTLTEFTATIEFTERRSYQLDSATVARLGSVREEA
jgi:hypothetical protein